MDLTLPIPMAIAIVVGSMVIAGFVVRSIDRGRRRDLRRESQDLGRLLAAVLADRVAADDLRGAVDRVTAGTFWTALERVSLRLRYVSWLRLSRALEGNSHSRAERNALRDDSPWRRVLAARRLGLLRSERSRRALRRALVRGPEMVTIAAAASLARARDRGALRWLLSHPECLARRSPASLVGVLRAFGHAALPDLSAALAHGLDSHRLERAVIETLGLGGHHAARAALEERLTSGDLDLRVAAVRALGRIRSIESSTALLACLKDEAWQVRAQAARALGQVGAVIAVPVLATRVTDPSWWVRRHAAYALHELGHEGQTALRRVAETSSDTYAREMAREALEGGFVTLRATPGASRPRRQA